MEKKEEPNKTTEHQPAAEATKQPEQKMHVPPKRKEVRSILKLKKPKKPIEDDDDDCGESEKTEKTRTRQDEGPKDVLALASADNSSGAGAAGAAPIINPQTKIPQTYASERFMEDMKRAFSDLDIFTCSMEVFGSLVAGPCQIGPTKVDIVDEALEDDDAQSKAMTVTSTIEETRSVLMEMEEKDDKKKGNTIGPVFDDLKGAFREGGLQDVIPDACSSIQDACNGLTDPANYDTKAKTQKAQTQAQQSRSQPRSQQPPGDISFSKRPATPSSETMAAIDKAIQNLEDQSSHGLSEAALEQLESKMAKRKYQSHRKSKIRERMEAFAESLGLEEDDDEDGSGSDFLPPPTLLPVSEASSTDSDKSKRKQQQRSQSSQPSRLQLARARSKKIRDFAPADFPAELLP
eukprot:CAMPEP_0118691760 /NCGR_PEP_ID=MMETSP0800-20121206/10869_1 /TAXON_ID=210618 ORGANISM="Striatella unipunctata, Strain CCMP2910" /NCGR_SAMPLE_ID=MMETSP0800 /ASSEMBLY_ACC=CAM_ASM_000638 /LENGTH=405 /DNA_ID=CAMNT_0006589595 /DNA_START=103 /DNA_END=1320 /DNA_ORIENTATION=+